jgi:hypothetical protein
VVFEILSPGNRLAEMTAKFEFYNRHGVEEYYIDDPDKVDFTGWLRQDGVLQGIVDISGWVSPRLGVRFELGDELEIYTSSNELFLLVLEIDRQKKQLQLGMQQAKLETSEAKLVIQQERDQADAAEQKAATLTAKLRELGVDVD